jgi:hypothetical protein
MPFHLLGLFLTQFLLLAQPQAALAESPNLVTIDQGWARNSINAVVFRRNSVVTHGDTQFVAFYDEEGHVTLAKRMLGSSDWEIRRTRYKGDTRDAHNSISIMVDGDGYLHMAWDHHGDPLRYCRSVKPTSLTLTEKLSMTGYKETNVTYPEFYRLPDGDLLFLYRDGSSGRGDLIMNRYDPEMQEWRTLQEKLVDGEGERNAYWQLAVAREGTIHLSWVWRESGDVATNHDLCYAKSVDGGRTWVRSSGEVYRLPITLESAEYAWRIPEGSELINQTSMDTDNAGNPFIASYWRPEGTDVPQYQLVHHDGNSWQNFVVSSRRMPFTLSGGGTKRIPISRPQILVRGTGEETRAHLVFRDSERGSRISIASCQDLKARKWEIQDLTQFSVGMWEPTYDTELWKTSGVLHLFIQTVGQGDGETLDDIPPQTVSILEWVPR